MEELPLYEPSGSGTHSWLWIEKRRHNTLDAARRLAALLNVRAADAGIGGLKDAQSVSRQWISFEHVSELALKEIETLADPNIRVLNVTRHGNKLKMGHLRGNRFIVRLRVANCAGTRAANGGLPVAHIDSRATGSLLLAARDILEDRTREVLSRLVEKGIPNYYGPQRFGRDGLNADLGRMLVKGDVAAFEKMYADTSQSRRPDRKLRNLLVNSFQSALFNQVLASRMPEIGRLQAGDLAFLHRNGAVFKVASAEETAREQARADKFEISPSGPLFGERTLLPDGEPGELERRVLAEAGVSLADFGRKEAESQPGARRALRIGFLEPPTSESDAEGVVLRFALPSGSYASVVIREIIGDGENQNALPE